jgi:hypothetical protein
MAGSRRSGLCQGQKSPRHHGVEPDGGPEQDPEEVPSGAEIGEVDRDRRVVGQHRTDRRRRTTVVGSSISRNPVPISTIAEKTRILR